MNRLPAILLYRGRGPVSRVIRWQTRSPYSHASILLPDGVTVIESIQFKGVHLRSLFDPKFTDPFDAFSLAHATIGQWAQIETFARAELGAGYDYRNIFRFVTRTTSGHDTRWFCSELVFAAVASAGIKLLERIEPWAVSPGDLALSPILQPMEIA